MRAFRQRTAVISQSVYISTKPSLVCSSNHNGKFRHFINTADLFLIKEFHTSELWSLNISNLKASLLQHVKRLFSVYFILSITFPPRKRHSASRHCTKRVTTLSLPAALQESSTCDSGEYAQTCCFQQWSWSASASLRNSVPFKQSIAEINTQLPGKVEEFCFSAVGFIFMAVNHRIIFTIPALQSNKCNNLWPRPLAKQEWVKLKDRTQEGSKEGYVSPDLTSMQFTLERKTGES